METDASDETLVSTTLYMPAVRVETMSVFVPADGVLANTTMLRTYGSGAIR